MKAIVIGCGRLGSAIALELYRKGNEVTVVDKDSDSFALLGNEFNGNTIVGIGFDKNVLEEAGIQFQDAVICTTDSDEVNVLCGKISKDIFMVPQVVARLYDPRKAKIFESLGIKTISTTGYGVDRAIELLSYDKMDSITLLGARGDTELVRIHATSNVEGALAHELTVNGEVRQHGNTRNMIFPVARLISYVTRFMTMEPGDILITGTPEGVSEIRPGDTVRAEIRGVGSVTNPVTSR